MQRREEEMIVGEIGEECIGDECRGDEGEQRKREDRR